jgi:hypothetical protein
MNQKKEQPNSGIKIKFSIDCSSKDAADKLRTDKFKASVNKDIRSIYQKNTKR